VRHLSLASGGDLLQDPRVSAVKRHVQRATLLLTFLGRVLSRAGREFERVVAVRATESALEFIADASQWAAWADPARALKTTDVWKNYFKEWWRPVQARSKDEAQVGFQPIAQHFIQWHKAELEAELSQLDSWLKHRAEEIIVESGPAAEQATLFPSSAWASAPLPKAASWQHLTAPQERLAAFASDASQTGRARAEAEGVLRLYKQRLAALNSRLSLEPPVIIPWECL
jgi:hypothetical protein